MDVVGSVAAISQLALYIQCAVRGLRHTCETLKNSTSFAKSQLEELQVLLEILDRIQRHHSPSDIEDLVPVLISIADTTQILRNWFEPPKTLRQKLNLIAHQSEIDERFRRLREKYNLLVLYYSERNHYALGRIESSLNARHHLAAASTESMSSPIAPNTSRPMSAVQPESSEALARNDETAPPPANTPSIGAGLSPGHITEDMFKLFFTSNPNPNHRQQNDQPSKDEETGQSSENEQGNVNIQVDRNRLLHTHIEIAQNRPEHSAIDGSYCDNHVFGGTMKVAGMTPQAGKESGPQ